MSLLNRRTAGLTLCIFLATALIFHLLVLAGIIPYGIVWGGKLQDRKQMLTAESISIVLNLLMLAVAGAFTGVPGLKTLNVRTAKISMWAMSLLFILNTIGNFLSSNAFERNIFTPVTLLLSVLCIYLASAKTKRHEG